VALYWHFSCEVNGEQKAAVLRLSLFNRFNVVRDSAQAVLVGAKVTVSNSQTNLSQSTISAADGSYRFLALAAGTYNIAVSAPAVPRVFPKTLWRWAFRADLLR
jgi:hypothetical protein